MATRLEPLGSAHLKEIEMPEDLFTHRSAWRLALVQCRDAAPIFAATYIIEPVA